MARVVSSFVAPPKHRDPSPCLCLSVTDRHTFSLDRMERDAWMGRGCFSLGATALRLRASLEAIEGKKARNGREGVGFCSARYQE
jgi:hypothetical protein